MESKYSDTNTYLIESSVPNTGIIYPSMGYEKLICVGNSLDFLVVSEESNAYRVLDLKKRIVVSRDVIFDENRAVDIGFPNNNDV